MHISNKELFTGIMGEKNVGGTMTVRQLYLSATYRDLGVTPLMATPEIGK